MTSVTTALENLYQIFSSVRPPTAIEACPCCLDTNEIDTLLRTPLRTLTPNDLASYASSVFYTVGNAADFRYFLPRILDISAHDPDWYPTIEIVLGKLQRANWLHWSTAEVQTVTQFAMAIFMNLLEHDDNSGQDIDSWICGFGRAGMDLTPFLIQLQALPYRKKLVEFYEVNSAKLLKGALRNAFWDEHPEAMHRIVDWFHSSAIEQAILEVYGLVAETSESP
jgi:hypothetical protein